MLYLVGLGLGDVKDITVRGLEVVKQASKVYLEAYTSVLTVGKDTLEEFYGRPVIVADREFMEQGSNTVLEEARLTDVAVLVVGDPLSATTHTDFILRAIQEGVPYQIVHNTSILNAVGCCGLQLYNFGETVSIPYWTDNWKPESFFDKIEGNKKRGLHTLCLLDIKIKEPNLEAMMRGRTVYDPPRFMSVREAALQLVEIVRNRQNDKTVACSEDMLCVGLSHVGSPTQKLLTCSLDEMTGADLGPPLHSLIIVGSLHPLERTFIGMFAENKEQFGEKT